MQEASTYLYLLKTTDGQRARRADSRVLAPVIPVSSHQDTVGPMTRSVADATAILTVIAGRDPLDNFTLAQPETVPDFTQALNASALNGARLGIPRLFQSNDPNIMAAFNASVEIIRGLGATIGWFAQYASITAFLN